MGYIPDNYDAWCSHQSDKERRLARYPKCYLCDEPILEEKCFRIDGELICEHCIEDYIKENYEVDTEDYCE